MKKECITDRIIIADGGFDYSPEGKKFMELPNARVDYLVSVGMLPDGVYLLKGDAAKIERIKKGKSV